MKLLFVTQAVDQDDKYLSFAHRWVEELAEKAERLEVICLLEGRHSLPENVRVHSLGKERGKKSRVLYALRFLSFTWKLRHDYDLVLVHMNQEYILIAGWLWKLLGKRVYMWRNHYAGSWLTDLAAAFCTRVFCTSKHSHTAKYKKTVLMPVGVDLTLFRPGAAVVRNPRSVLFLARITPSKRPDMLVEALGLLISRGVSFTATVVGSPLPDDERYYESLKARAESQGLHDRVRFLPGVPNRETLPLYRSHEIFVNCSPSGMFDKTLFEAATSGCLVLATSQDFCELAGSDSHFSAASDLAERLETYLTYSPEEKAAISIKLQDLSRNNSLRVTVEKLHAMLV